MATTTPPKANRRAGEFLLAQDGADGYWAFHPRPLPPQPPIEIDGPTQALLDQANQALGRLDGITLLLPDADQFLYTYLRKEAVLSSQIEGTQSSLSDLLLLENEAGGSARAHDAHEPLNYLAAVEHGMKRITDGDLPLCNRLLREVHRILLRSGRGSEQNPGEYRRDQNWLGGTKPSNARYVPPPWPAVEPAMSDLEKFLHGDPEPTPILIKAALAHAQFESIHPFLDGNGRLGRLLITLLLQAEGVLKRPLLYLSLYLKQNRDSYYDHLQRVRTDGAWEAWLRFFLEGVIEVADSTTDTTRRIVEMVELDRARIHEQLGRGAATAARIHGIALRTVLVRPKSAAAELQLTGPPVYAAIERLEQVGILREFTGRKRGKVWVYREYLHLLEEGTEPL